ncbi:MAG: IclR family transcriptional regulator [Propionibacteriaceae bacterium]|jgi:DNA-binding IclR family transcriptional regulator|nr:IclR family transcriptional regulator [Propionibacteriaceae bacterium]
MPKSSPDQSPVKSADRVLKLLDALAARGGRPARLHELVEELDAPKSSVHALLRTATLTGWVRTDPTGMLYTLDLHALVVGASFLDADPYVRLARPVLSELRDQLHETVHLARWDRGNVVYLITQESGRDLRRVNRIGHALPAYATSLGKALLAERATSKEDDAAQAVNDGPLEAWTASTVTDPQVLAAELTLTRRRGYALDNQEVIPGLVCVGLALRYTDPVVDAISCSVPVERMTPEHQAEIIEALTRVRDTLEASAPVQGTF